MATSYFGFSVSNTNGNKRQRSVVRVYDESGKMIAEQFINKHNPLAYVREHSTGRHYAELKQQCLTGGMTEKEFSFIF